MYICTVSGQNICKIVEIWLLVAREHFFVKKNCQWGNFSPIFLVATSLSRFLFFIYLFTFQLILSWNNRVLHFVTNGGNVSSAQNMPLSFDQTSYCSSAINWQNSIFIMHLLLTHSVTDGNHNPGRVWLEPFNLCIHSILSTNYFCSLINTKHVSLQMCSLCYTYIIFQISIIIMLKNNAT